MNKSILASGALAISLAGWSAGVGASTSTDSVLHWNEVAGEVAKLACLSPANNPFHESRLYAMVHIAIHDAVNAIERRSRHYAYHGTADPGASVGAAVAAAANGVIQSQIPLIPPLFDPGFNDVCVAPALAYAQSAYEAAIAAVTDGDADKGIEVGHEAATAVIALRASDGAATTPFADPFYPQGDEPGEWRFTDPEVLPLAVVPKWGEDVTPFVLAGPDQFRPGPPYPVSCSRRGHRRLADGCLLYALDLYEVKVYGGDETTGSIRSPDETQIALFWLESSPLAWNRIARSVSPDFGFDEWENARLLALLNMGLADGYIASVGAKYHYSFWRPKTAIREAGNDGNPFTRPDLDWEPLALTPPFPDYDSAHAVQGAVAAEVFRRVFGTDQVAFETCSLSVSTSAEELCGGSGEIRRSFSSFSEAAWENGRSRILVGYHFRKAVLAGLQHGRRIGSEAVRNYLRPTRH